MTPREMARASTRRITITESFQWFPKSCSQTSYMTFSNVGAKGVRKGGPTRTLFRNSKMSISAIICQKSFLRFPSGNDETWLSADLLVNRNKILAKFCAVDGRSPKKSHSPSLGQNFDRRRHQFSQTLEVNTISLRTIWALRLSCDNLHK